MTYSNIDGKFYPLQTGEYVRACKELTPAQKDVFYYLKTIDPFGDHCLEINVIEVAEQVGRTKFTVYKCLKVLDRLGWLELEPIFSRVRLWMRKSNKCNQCEPQKLSSEIQEKQVVPTDKGGNLTASFVHRDKVVAPVDKVTYSEPLPCKGFGSPKTNKTIKTNKSLSLRQKREREIF